MNYRTIWISDVHLGAPGSDAEALLSFLRQTESRRLYIVGDLVDLWQLRKSHYWPQAHNNVLQKLLRKGRKGTELIYIPGNHDEFCQHFIGAYGSVMIRRQAIHTTADGRRLLVMHGHEFDTVTMHARWLAVLGDVGYNLLLQLNRPLNWLRHRAGLPYWSLSAYAKSRVKSAVHFISQFEDAVVHYAELHEASGIVCGHIHTPAMRKIRHVNYYNCGDWVESGTALVEHENGRMELLRWKDVDPAGAGRAKELIPCNQS